MMMMMTKKKGPKRKRDIEMYLSYPKTTSFSFFFLF